MIERFAVRHDKPRAMIANSRARFKVEDQALLRFLERNICNLDFPERV